jgi:hypothetical protein
MPCLKQEVQPTPALVGTQPSLLWVAQSPGELLSGILHGWAIRPAQGHTKGVSYFRGEFGELFELGEGKRGCKYSARQMHAETLRCFPSRYDTADLIAHKKKGTVPGLTRLERKLEDKFPEVKQAAARGVRARARPRRAREDHERV